MILIDADSLVYACGFACQTAHSLLVVEDPEGHVQTDMSTNMTDWKSEHKGWTVLDRDVKIEAQPEAYAVQAIRLAVSTIIERCGGGKNQLFITGKTNFRDKLATIMPYKGNRDKLHKPVHYGALRDYLLAEGAILVEGMEADDEVSIRGHAALSSRKKGKKDSIVASIDKDLDQIPGKHYNPQKDEHYEIRRSDADQWFYRQVLTGDRVDNVGGCWRVGDVAADKILANGLSSGRAIWDLICDAYVESLTKTGCPYTDAAAAALENARLVFMLHKAEQAEEANWWTPEAVAGVTRDRIK